MISADAAPNSPGFVSLGQSTARTVAIRAGARHRLGRTFLVHGPAGAGKGTFVDDLMALLLCTDVDPLARPCNACAGCHGARTHAHPDLVMGSPEIWRDSRGTGESVVAAARRWLGATAGAPIAGDRRVVLIEGADRASEQIQNALLKGLEEPSERHVFILVADEPNRLLETVRSRCQPLRIGPVPRADLAAWLMDHERLPRDQADALARISEGLVGRALSFARNPQKLIWRGRIQRELLGLLREGRAERFASARELLDDATRSTSVAAAPESASDDAEASRAPASAQRAGASAIVDAWLGLSRDLMVLAAGKDEGLPTHELVPDLTTAAAGLDPQEMTGFIELLERIREGLAENAAPRLALEVAMLTWPRLSAP